MLHQKEIFQKYKEFGQEHVFRFYDELSDSSKSAFLKQLASIDLKEVAQIYDSTKTSEVKLSGKLEAAEVKKIPTTQTETREFQGAFELGEKLIRAGKVACFVVAGGQGSRLGFEGPKGAFDVRLPSGKSLFALQADQIHAASKYYGVEIPWYIMTSQSNHMETIQFFETHQYFSLNKSNVRFFSQDMLPAVDVNGKLILSEKGSLFMSPNGHGGSLLGLERSGALDEMKARGIEYISYYQVDNILIKILDPVFIGFHAKQNAEMSFKMVRKRNAEEKVGVVGKRNGIIEVIEYSDLPKDEMFAKSNNDELKFWSGSIAIHLISVDFNKRIVAKGFSLPFHKAEKAIPFIDATGKEVRPQEKNGIKFETFVFDAVQFTRNVFLLEVDRTEEFGPVKNKDGEDSPETARQMYMDRCRKVLLENIKDPVEISKVQQAKRIEISPFNAYRKKELEGLLKKIAPNEEEICLL